MSALQPRQPDPALRALRADLRDADDGKIRQIVAMLDESPVNQISQAVLDPLRPRLAILKPSRPLRFTRLLFMPFNDLIVPAPDWRPDQATIPHSILQSLSNTVQTAMGDEAQAIHRMIDGHNTGETEVVTRSGQMLWACAAEILATAPEPADWAATGLRPAAYPPLARAVATVLRRAAALRLLLRHAELGVLKPDEHAIREIISKLADEPSDGRAMVCKLILAQLPHAASLLRQLADPSWGPAEKFLLQTAIDRGIEDILVDMESQTALSKDLRDGPLADVGSEVQRIAGLLEDINDSSHTTQQRARVHGIREKLDSICRLRFVDGMATGLVAPLAAATAPIDSDSQKWLEDCARDLRILETTGRKLGGATAYDAMLIKAGEAVQTAAQSGCLNTPRAVRLVEILSGPEAAEAMYKRAAATVRVR